MKKNLMNTHIPVLGNKAIPIELKPMYPALIAAPSPPFGVFKHILNSVTFISMHFFLVLLHASIYVYFLNHI